MALRRELDQIQFEAPTRFLLIPARNIGYLKGSQPSVRDNEYWRADDGSAITDFKFGAPAQRLYILGDGITSVVHGATIKTNTSATKVLLLNQVYIFLHFNGVWYETAA